MAYLRDRFKGQQISQEGTELLLASWGQKSSKSYDSLFGKWVRWCDQRNSDPISGPVSEVVNFLADLFNKATSIDPSMPTDQQYRQYMTKWRGWLWDSTPW